MQNDGILSYIKENISELTNEYSKQEQQLSISEDKEVTWDCQEHLKTFAGINECIKFQNKHSYYYSKNPKETMVVLYITPGNAYYEGPAAEPLTGYDVTNLAFVDDYVIDGINGLHIMRLDRVGFYVTVDQDVLKDEKLLKMILSQKEKLISL